MHRNEFTIEKLHLKLAIIEQSRFKNWFSSERLKYLDGYKIKLYRDFRAYFRLYDDLIAAGDACRTDGHSGDTALMSTCNAVIDRAAPYPQHVQIIEALQSFIEHTKKHQHTPIWAEMRAVAEQYYEDLKWG